LNFPFLEIALCPHLCTIEMSDRCWDFTFNPLIVNFASHHERNIFVNSLNFHLFCEDGKIILFQRQQEATKGRVNGRRILFLVGVGVCMGVCAFAGAERVWGRDCVMCVRV